jgi:hypothetical protein
VAVGGGGRPVSVPVGGCRAAPSRCGYIAVASACGPRLSPSRSSCWEPRMFHGGPCLPPRVVGRGWGAPPPPSGQFLRLREGSGAKAKASGPRANDGDALECRLPSRRHSHFLPLLCVFRVKALTMLVGRRWCLWRRSLL